VPQMQIDLALLADAATVDVSGKLNILGVFDRITTAEFPAPPLRVCLVLRFSASVSEAGAHAVLITLKGPVGQEIFRLDGEMMMAPGAGSNEDGIHVPQVLNMDGVVFERPGRYSFDVGIDGEHHVSVPLNVVELAARALA
jgi:hypothetical protein